jgi:hypothetical protein
MRIAIDIDGVLRDTFTKIEQIYQKYFIDELELVDDDFKYEIITPYDTPEYSNHFKFKTDEEYLSFMYEEFAMEIFGHSPSTEMSTFYDLNDLIVKYKDNVKFLLISKQVSKTKPATLFFVSKFGCEIEKIVFYNQLTKDDVWNEFDVLITANPDLLLQKDNKTLIKYETSYNLKIESDITISDLKGLDKKIEILIEK